MSIHVYQITNILRDAIKTGVEYWHYYFCCINGTNSTTTDGSTN